MTRQEIEAEAKRLAEQYGVYKAFAMVKNRLVQYENTWTRRINSDRLAYEKHLLDAIAHLVTKDAMNRMGWVFAPPEDEEPSEWRFRPYEWGNDERGRLVCPLCHSSTDNKSGSALFCPRCGSRLAKVSGSEAAKQKNNPRE